MGRSDEGRGGPLCVSRRLEGFWIRDRSNFQCRDSVDATWNVVIDERFSIEVEVSLL